MPEREGTGSYAGFWRRASAFALDYGVILLYIVGMTLLSLLINRLFNINPWLFSSRIRAQVTGFLLLTLPVSLYFALAESSPRQATWGKQKLGIKVMDAEGKRIGLWRSLARTGLKFVPWELSHTLIWTLYFSPQPDSTFISYGFVLVYALIGLNLASLLITKRTQAIYDILARTYVVRQRR